ncbi:hypothetical protein [Alteraurantiacibacter aquimixticola]|uniref:Uncharacterized protein n=1 Tax=Alteraurantiacibacter aquimixticola TaxID=2489173 RepID=A0A4T3F336_9SPHN|nr:hypothetical protein [Alteraurantiacibacter aquimixticola]TIX51685.1 hypothetical protein E5222_04340 [Alteraurantiacibacter aquimixticola]
MTDLAFLTISALILAGTGAAAWMLRRSWQAKAGNPQWRLAGWALLGACLILPAFALGEARGPFIALSLASVAALLVVASGYRLRERKSGRSSLAPEPAERLSTTWRGVLRWLLAGPVGMISAMGLGICYAVWVPGEPQTRLVVGGMIVPIAWGGAMAWTLADSRILRATTVLVGVAIFGFGASIMKGFT